MNMSTWRRFSCMNAAIGFAPMLAMALMLSGISSAIAQPTAASLGGHSSSKAKPARPRGPCDIYANTGDPCVAAYSTTRAMYASYGGPLYQVKRQSDGKVLNIGVVQPVAAPMPDAGGYADAAAQDAFCANTTCWITRLYDQSPKHNDLTQAPRGNWKGPAMGGMDNLPIANMAPVMVMGHKVYGIFIEPGMGLRNDDPTGTAVDDQAEGQYWVVNGKHYNDGCCFDFGNAEIDSHDDDNGTMEATYFGDAGAWYHGKGSGPWIMTDQENNLVGCVNQDGSKSCPDLPSIKWRFVTATADGKPHHWRSMGGDAQRGAISVMFSGPRINSSYDPMRKQGAILLGNGGDNSNSSQGTFYEGAMTAAGTFPTQATEQRMQANVVAASYRGFPLSVAPASDMATPPGLQTFSPGSTQTTTVRFTNTTGAAAEGVKLSLSMPNAQWRSVVSGTSMGSKTFAHPVASGKSVSATFKVTSGSKAFNGDMVGKVWWTNVKSGTTHSLTRAEKARNVRPIKIQAFRIGTKSPTNATNSFIELYNTGASGVDISNWTLTEHPMRQAVFSRVKIPAGTKLAAHGYYVLGLSNSGLVVPAHAGHATIHVRSTTGMKAGDTISIGFGANAETRKIAWLGTAASHETTLWQPLPAGSMTISAGSTNVPVTSVSGFSVGQKIALGYGATAPTVPETQEKYEVVTVTKVGTPGTQDYLAAGAHAGATSIVVKSVKNISVGDRIRLDIDSVGHGIETVTVKRVDRGNKRLDLAAPLRFNHAANLPFSDRGTGISFNPATNFAHLSNEPVQPLGTGITLSRPLAKGHAINAVVRDAKVMRAGYHGKATPDQWFGGPVIVSSQVSPGHKGHAGSMVLRDADGLVVDSLNYGRVVDPWAAEGYQARSGKGQRGCYVATPGLASGAGVSAVRIHETDSNCTDFVTKPTSLPANGASNGQSR
jgi:hypothetical protein